MVYFVSVILIVISCLFGWMAGITSITKECQLLGSFYVVNTVYECKVKKKYD